MIQFFGMQYKNILSNTSSQAVVRFFTSFTTLVLMLMITKILGVGMYGSFTKIITFISFFYLLVDLGINPIFIKSYMNGTEKSLHNLFLLRLLLALFAFILVLIVINFLPFNKALNTGFSTFEKIGIILYSLTLFTQSIFLSIQTIIQKNLLYKYMIAPTVTSSLVLLAFGLIGVDQKNLYLILFSFTLSSTLLIAILYLTLKNRKLIYLKKSSDFLKFARSIIIESFPLGLMLFFNIIYFKADTFILSVFTTPASVGIYSFAYRIFEFVISFPTFFSNSLYPILLEKQIEQDKFKKHVKSYAVFLTIISFALMLLLNLFAPFIVFINKDLSGAIFLLRILSLSLPFFFLTSLLQWVMIIKNKKNILVIIYAISMMLNIFLNLIFIPRFTTTAAALTTVFSEGFVFSLLIGSLLLRPVKNTRKGP